MQHPLIPLLPSPQFRKMEVVTQLIHSCLAVPSISGKITMFLTSGLGRGFPLVPPLQNMLYLPSTAVNLLIGNSEKNYRRFSWLAPLTSIPLVTYAAHISYLSAYSAIAKGIVLGVHCTAMMVFTIAPASWSGIISLRGSIHALIIDPSKYNISAEELAKFKMQVEKVQSVTFAVSSIAINVITGNPIIANAVAYPLAAIAAAASARFFLDRSVQAAVAQ